MEDSCHDGPLVDKTMSAMASFRSTTSPFVPDTGGQGLKHHVVIAAWLQEARWL